jgi:hypothetical protein
MMLDPGECASSEKTRLDRNQNIILAGPIAIKSTAYLRLIQNIIYILYIYICEETSLMIQLDPAARIGIPSNPGTHRVRVRISLTHYGSQEHI